MGKILVIGVKEGNGPNTRYEYKNKVNLNDCKLIALVLNDLKEGFGCPIDKVIKLLLEGENDKVFPI